MRCTLETDSPLSFAMPRELQWVASEEGFPRFLRWWLRCAHHRSSEVLRALAHRAGPLRAARQTACATYQLSLRLRLASPPLPCSGCLLRRPERSGLSTPGPGPSCGGPPTPSAQPVPHRLKSGVLVAAPSNAPSLLPRTT